MALGILLFPWSKTTVTKTYKTLDQIKCILLYVTSLKIFTQTLREHSSFSDSNIPVTQGSYPNERKDKNPKHMDLSFDLELENILSSVIQLFVSTRPVV